jgi:hypothetical protein
MTATMTARLVKLYEGAPQEVRNAGSTWYADAQSAARDMAKEHRTTEAVAAGVIAALSPRINWVRNLAVARLVLARRKVTGVFQASLNKARRILAGARPLGVLSGPKTRAFYRALRGDQDAAVIDVWMLRAVRYANDKVSAIDYERITQALAKAASRVGVTIARMQAIIWTVVRGRAT